MSNYRRAFVPGGRWFFTANLLNRRSGLLTKEIAALREATRYTRDRHPFRIDAFVVLPDHIHTIWTLPLDDADFSTRWRLIKIEFSKSIPRTERLSAVRRARGERGIWQRRFLGASNQGRRGLSPPCRVLLHQSREAWTRHTRMRLALLIVPPGR
jgi:putative transposase